MEHDGALRCAVKSETAEPQPPNHLRAWRRASGLTQTQVEKVLGWPQSRVSHLELGNASLTDQVLAMLAPLYNCEPADLLRGPPTQKADKPKVAALYEAEQTLRKLLDDFHAVKADLVPILEALESQMTRVRAAVAETVDSAVEASAMLAHTTAVLTAAIGKKPRGARAESEAEPPVEGS